MHPIHLKFIVAGVSGVGKSTILNLLKKTDASHSITVHQKDTTRTPRPSDSDFQDVSCISTEEFEKRRRNREYELIFTGKSGKLYGVRHDQLVKACAEKEIHFIIFRNFSAIRKFKSIHPDTKVIYMYTDRENLFEHLKQRNGIDDSAISMAINMIRVEFQEFIDNNTLFDHVIINTREEANCVQQLLNIIDKYVRV